MASSSRKRFETHFEIAIRLSITPQRVKRMALNHEFGDYGVIGGVVLLPTAGNDLSVIEDLLAIRYGLIM